MLLSDCCWPHRDGFIPSVFIAYNLQKPRWDALKDTKNPRKYECSKNGVVCCRNMEPDPRVLCLYFSEGAGLLFLFKIGCHGGFIRAFALMKIVCISDAAALATQCLHLPPTEQQLWNWNLALHLCTPNRFLKHPVAPGWHTWGEVAEAEEPASPEAAETSDKMEMLLWNPTARGIFPQMWPWCAVWILLEFLGRFSSLVLKVMGSPAWHSDLLIQESLPFSNEPQSLASLCHRQPVIPWIRWMAATRTLGNVYEQYRLSLPKKELFICIYFRWQFNFWPKLKGPPKLHSVSHLLLILQGTFTGINPRQSEISRRFLGLKLSLYWKQVFWNTKPPARDRGG